MKQEQLLRFLIEANLDDPNIQAYFDRLMMRLFESPALLASFVNATIFKQDKDVVIQLEFQRVPKEFHQDLSKIAGAREVQILNYEKGSTQYTGMQVKLDVEDITPAEPPKDELGAPFQKDQLVRAGSLDMSDGLR